MIDRRTIRQTRSGVVKQPFHILLAPDLRVQLGQIAEETGCSVAALMSSWVGFLAARYDSVEHLNLPSPEEWGVEWRFTNGHNIWDIFSGRNRIRYPLIEDGVGNSDEGSEADRQEPTQADFDTLGHAATEAIERLVDAVEAEPDGSPEHDFGASGGAL